MKQNPRPYGALPAAGFVRANGVLEVVPFSRATLWRLVRDGGFPAPIKLGPKMTAWPVAAVRAWLDAQASK